MTDPLFILASSSPRRLSLLDSIGLTPDHVMAADISELPLKVEMPRKLALRLAREKAEAVMDRVHEPALILGADTVVACGNRILPKAENAEEVRHYLKILSGRRHHVITGVAIADTRTKKILQTYSDTIVCYRRLGQLEIEAYARTDEGIGKAGGYSIQGKAATFVKQIMGSYSGVVGLPLYEVSQLLAKLGY